MNDWEKRFQEIKLQKQKMNQTKTDLNMRVQKEKENLLKKLDDKRKEKACACK